MQTLLYFVLGNAVLAAIMALSVAVIARWCRRPALVHGLWLLVLLKLITPSFLPIPIQKFLPVPGEARRAELAPTVPEPLSTANAAPIIPQPGEGQWEEALADLSELVLPAFPIVEEAVNPEPEPLVELPVAVASAPVAEQGRMPWPTLCVGIWLGGSLCWFGLAAVRLVRFRRFLDRACAAPTALQLRVQTLAVRLGLLRPPQILVLPAAVSPMLWAMGGPPRLLLPASLLHRLSGEQWDTLLAHELAHLRRRDHWVRLLELAVLGLNWWHPVAWWARRELREAEEQCCDAWVVWALPALAEAYALALLETVTFLSQSRSALPVAASGIGQVHFLRRRLTMIMRGTTPRALSSLGLLAVVGLGALVLPLLPTWAQGDEPQPAGDDLVAPAALPQPAPPDEAPDPPSVQPPGALTPL